MNKQEHNVITFLKNHGKEILERERYKYEPIKKEAKDIQNQSDTEKEKIEYLQLKLEKQGQELEKIKEENDKLKLNTNKEWFSKYKKYKTKYKSVKKELKETKKELRQVKQELYQEIEETKNELNFLKEEIKKFKGKIVIDENSQKTISDSESSSNSSKQDIISSSNSSKKDVINFIEESESEGKSEIEKENDQIIQALSKMKNINAIIKEEPESDEPIDTDMETIVNEDVDNYPEEELIDPNLEVITRNSSKIPNHIPIGQHAEFKEFVGSMSQGVNLNGYFLDLDNVYEEQEISRRITDWNLGTYIALMSSTHTNNLEYIYDLISKTLIGKVAFWIESIDYQLKTEVMRSAGDWKSMLQIFDMILKREFLGEPWIVARDQVLVERKIEIIMNLNNMKCCKINKLPEYTISFTKFFYEAIFLPMKV